MQTTHRFPTADALFEGAAELLISRIGDALARKGSCAIALAGGSTPRALYERLAAPDRAGRVDWSRVDVWFGDERCVPPEAATSNFRMANAALLSHVPIPPTRVHRIEGELAPGLAAARYAALLAGAPPLDIVLLGMGDDGHTASLFPGADELDAEGLVAATESPVEPFDRVSLTLRAINAARDVIFLVSGASKAPRLAEVQSQRASGAPTLPAARVNARSVTWLVDNAAAG